MTYVTQQLIIHMSRSQETANMGEIEAKGRDRPSPFQGGDW
jgi:hypothetical protein